MIVLNRALGLRNASDDLMSRLRNVSQDLGDFSGKIKELVNLTSMSEDNVKTAKDAMSKNYSSDLRVRSFLPILRK